MSGSTEAGGSRRAAALAAAALVAGVVVAAFDDPAALGEPLAVLLCACAVASRLIAVTYRGRLFVTGAYLCGMLAVGFLGAAPAFAIPVVAELVGWAVERYRRVPLLINLATSATPTAVAATLFAGLSLDEESAGFAFALAGFGAAVFAVNVMTVRPLMALLDGEPLRPALRFPVDLAPAAALNIAIAAALAALYASTGLAVISLVLLAGLAYSYMAQLVVAARERTRQYADLSWGVLSGLLRTLDARDPRAARHCAAVAAFARDIARAAGLGEREQELAHTAGLLHDIGRFALSDRVLDRGVTLTDDDWVAVRRHPEIGADLLRDIGVYGPLSEVVVAHHERPDGRGYPRGLAGDAIPEIARIVAVAEVYDTLTAHDTYRTQLSSFEALTELRRVSGTQLDGRFVEVLADLLAGRGVEYRHAGDADFDAELDIERRINEAAAP